MMNIFKEFSRKRKPMATKKPGLLVNDKIVLQTLSDKERQKERIINKFIVADQGRSLCRIHIRSWIETRQAKGNTLDEIE